MDPLPGFQNQCFCLFCLLLCLFGAGCLFLALFFDGLLEGEYFGFGAHFVRYVAVARDSVFPRWVFARAREGLASPVYARVCGCEGAERWLVWV